MRMKLSIRPFIFLFSTIAILILAPHVFLTRIVFSGLESDPEVDLNGNTYGYSSSGFHVGFDTFDSYLPVLATDNRVSLVGQIGGDLQAVAVSGIYAYVGEGMGLTILDISRPATPRIKGKAFPLPDTI